LFQSIDYLIKHILVDSRDVVDEMVCSYAMTCSYALWPKFQYSEIEKVFLHLQYCTSRAFVGIYLEKGIDLLLEKMLKDCDISFDEKNRLKDKTILIGQLIFLQTYPDLKDTWLLKNWWEKK